ncbi:MAG: hypothetical protein ACLQBB_12610 [Solirubrobacteraceae bacterium]
MAPRHRAVAFGTAALLVVAGGVCAAVVGGLAGEILTIVLISGGLAGALLLVFLEIGLGEESDLAEEDERRREREARAVQTGRRPRLTRRPRRPE